MPSKDYMAEYRAKHPEYVAAEQKRARAKDRAYRRLAREYLKRFNEILKEELAREGTADA